MDQTRKSLQQRFHRDLRPGLIAFFTRRVGSITEAEDLAQEVYLRLARSPEDGPRETYAYVFRIASNLIRDRARRATVRNRHLAAVAQDPARAIDPFDPHRIVAGKEALATVVRALDELPERTRTIFLLYRYEQVDRKVIAESFGISVSAVAKHVYKALALLSERLGEAS